MIKKKVIALMVTGGMLASIGLSASAFTKTTTGSAVTKTTQTQTQTLSKFQRGNGQTDIKTQLDALVKSGKITQAIEDKVVAYLAKVDTDRQAEMDKVKAMTEAERQTYFNTKTKTDIFTDLVKSNTLTQSEANTLKTACPQLQMGDRGGKGHDRGQGPHHDGANDVDRQAEMKTKLDALVKAGTITQATEDKVIAYQSKLISERQAEMDKVKAMTDTERKAYFDSKTKTERPDQLADMVKAGTITQSEADSLKTILPQK